MRQRPKSLKPKAKLPVAPKLPKNQNSQVRDLEKRLTEALEHQNATSEILGVISSSPTDLQPVLDAVAERAARLCNADDVKIHLVDGDTLRLAAQRGPIPSVDARPIIPTRHIGRAVLERQTIHVHDMRTALDQFPDAAADVLTYGPRTALATPLLRDGVAIGVIQIRRLEVKPFAEKQIALLETFADQAVIAIENVRLFKELQERNRALTQAHAQVAESLEQQTAASEILRVISSSPTDIQPVFDAIVARATNLCGALFSALFRFDGELLHFVAHHNFPAEAVEAFTRDFPTRLEGTTTARAILERRVVNVADVLADPTQSAKALARAQALGYRSILAVPMFREGQAIGTIAVVRPQVGGFTDKQVELLKTFADQAVIAIENVRLFTELETRNRDLTVALDQQTATAEILRVISESPTDSQPVFDAIAYSAVHLCESTYGVVHLFDGTNIQQPIATCNVSDEQLALYRRIFPLTASIDTALGEAVVTRRTVQVEDTLSEHRYTSDTEPVRVARGALGHRTLLVVPMLHRDQALGIITVWRREQRPFVPKQIALVQTFADQAVIAIENVRLFAELGKKNRALTVAHAQVTESLEQQTATSDILRVISQSPTDVRPVFDTIVESVVQLCDGVSATVYQFDGDLIHLIAHHHSVTSAVRGVFERVYPLPPSRTSVVAQAILDRVVIHVRDFELDPDIPSASREMARAVGHRSLVAVPMLRDHNPIGAISVGRRGPQGAPRPFSDSEIAVLRTFADQAVIAIENVRLFTETKDALERQTATSEILRVISGSPTDAQPVFDAIVRSASLLCGGEHAIVTRYDGELLHLAAQHNPRPRAAEETEALFPQRPRRDASLSARALVDGRVVHIPDVASEELEPSVREAYRRMRLQALIAVPMVHEGRPIGVVSVSRATPGPFSDRQIALLRTFADQAVIAIENVRLFNETKEALERQTATAEILGVISSSPTDVQPVLAAVAESATRLCAAYDAVISRLDGDILRLVAHHGPIPTRPGLAIPATRGTVAGRTVLDRQTVHVADLQAEVEEFPEGSTIAQELGFRTILSVPLLREGVAIGAIDLRRTEVQLFNKTQIALLQTFADQAVIAIENVRLFTELQESNRELTTALDTQTATSDILRVISQSQTDVQPVFDAILSSAIRLMGAQAGVLTRITGDCLELAAFKSTDDRGEATIKAAFPLSLQSDGVHAKAIRDRSPINIAEAQSDARLRGRTIAHAVGYQSLVAIPMILQDVAVGTISATRRESGGFTDDEIALLQTFADQAVIAIENVRLFTELQEKNSALTTAHAQVSEALDQQMATSEILTVISRSTTDAQPVFDSIVRSAVRLCDGLFGAVNMFDGAMVQRPAAYHNYTPEALVAVQRTYPMRPSHQQLTGRAILNRTVAELPDVLNDPEYSPDIALAGGWRSGVAVPMLRDGHPIGTILVTRTHAGPFSKRQIGLLETFAAQAVIAIENVRLFKELEARTQDLTRSVAELRALDEVGQAISSTLDLQTVLRTIVARATQLSGTDAGVIYEYDESREVFVPRATERLNDEIVETMLATPVRKGEGATGRLAEVQEPIQVPDILAAPAESRVRGALVRAGYRALLAVPLVREGHLLGGLTVIRKATGAFPPEVIDLLTTFATQSALAIQNARLFREIEDKSRQLEVASQHKSEFLANMSHELRTPLNAIIGFSEVLTDRMFGELNEKQEEYLKDIYASGTHLLSLINDILDLSKIEAGRMELELTDFHLPTALDNALTLVRERAGRRNITLQMSVDERLGEVRADERKIRQVVLNLLSNAIKFTPEGGRVEIAAVPRVGLVEVSVSDTGVGIAPEDQEAVFEEFRQVGTAEKKAEGTGLGLTLCRKFIELHGGRIWVQSQVRMGSTFAFTIPVRCGE